MMKNCKRSLRGLGIVLAGAACSAAHAQVPDLMNALDAGSSSMGMGGSLKVTTADTMSGFYNPAGLGYLTRTEVGLSIRNLPSSTTVVSNSLSDPHYSTSTDSGRKGLTHVGIAIPLRRGIGGVISFAYTVGGYIDDLSGSVGAINLDSSGALQVNNYLQRRKAKQDFYTLAWGRTNSSQTLAYGIGLAYVQQHLEVTTSGTLTDGSNTPYSGPNGTSDGNGIGVIAGVQYIPPRTPNLNLGLSYRSEINLNNNDSTAAFYDKVPARLMAGVAYRQDGVRGGQDYIVYGLQLQHFFSAGEGLAFDRSAQSTVGLGLEYNLVRGGMRIPLRIGYSAIPSGGSGYGSRNSFTYGIGYRPAEGDYSIDLNFGTPEGGGQDLGVYASYRFK